MQDKRKAYKHIHNEMRNLSMSKLMRYLLNEAIKCITNGSSNMLNLLIKAIKC